MCIRDRYIIVLLITCIFEQKGKMVEYGKYKFHEALSLKCLTNIMCDALKLDTEYMLGGMPIPNVKLVPQLY